jgi:hypothetical protein
MWREWLLRQVCLIDLICEFVVLLLLIYIPPCYGTNDCSSSCDLRRVLSVLTLWFILYSARRTFA